MSKKKKHLSILLAERKQIKVYYDAICVVHAPACPVCQASNGVTERTYKPTNCALNLRDTSCHPSLQRRCKRIMWKMDKIVDILWAELVNIEKEIGELE